MQDENFYQDFRNDIFVTESDCFYKGQRIIYEGEEAEVVKVFPLLVIKTKNRVICGALQNAFKFVEKGISNGS